MSPTEFDTNIVIDELERRKITRDPVLFAQSLGFEPDAWQRGFLRSTSNRRILCCSRQLGKSTCTSLLVLHTALFKANSLILLISPSDRQSGELFKKVIEWLNIYMPERRLDAENKTTVEFPNKSRIVALPSKEGTIRAFSGVRLLVFDEASRVPDDLYHACRPMLLASKGSLIALSSPWGKRGWFYKEWTEGGDVWDRYRVPVTAVKRLITDSATLKFLEEEKHSKGERWFAQEYLCEFVELEDSVFSEGLVDAAFDPKIAPLFDGEVSPADGDAGIGLIDFGDR